MSVPPPTSRLTFRTWQPADIEPFHQLCADPDVMRYVGDGQPWPRERAEAFILRAESMQHALGYCQWVLEETGSARLAGYCGFVNSDLGSEIGWRLAQPFWNQGLATEAARAAVCHGFGVLGFTVISATVQVGNLASRRVAQKLGMTCIQQTTRNDRDVEIYSLAVPGLNP